MGCSGVYSTKNIFCKLKPEDINDITVYIDLTAEKPKNKYDTLYKEKITYTQLKTVPGTFETTMQKVRDNICTILKSADGDSREGNYTGVNMGEKGFGFSVFFYDRNNNERLYFAYGTRIGVLTSVHPIIKSKFLYLITYNTRPWFLQYSDRLGLPANESHTLACNVLRLLYKQAGMEIPEEIAWIVNSEVPKE